MGHAAIDQATVEQLAVADQVGEPLAGDLAVGGVVDIARCHVEITGPQHALVGQIAIGVDGQGAIGRQLAGIGQALAQGEAEIALRLQLAIAAERACVQPLIAARAQQPCGIGDRIGAHVQAAAAGNLTAAVVQRRAQLHGAGTVADHLPLAVV